MIKKMRKRVQAVMLSTIMVVSSIPTPSVNSANVEETQGNQLQTILVDNDGKEWTTLSWGGVTMTPNTNWTTLDISDYYDNGTITFDVKNNNSGMVNFALSLASHEHGKEIRIRLSDTEKYKNYFSADSEWKTYTLSIKEIVDLFPDSGFSLDNFQFIYVGSVPKTTTLSFRNVRISSTDDERQYPLWKVNQVGYLCNSVKTAKISYFSKFGSLNGKKWELVNADRNEIVKTGILDNGIIEEEFSGEIVHTVRFDDVTESGSYFLRIPDAGLDSSARSPYDISEELDLNDIASYRFRISDNVYDNLLNDLTKYYYYQRQGIEIEEKYAGDFARENLHPGDIAVKRWSDRDNPDAETFDVSGGWYDAGDFGKYTTPGAQSAEDLLLAYEFYPEIFDNMQMNIPETDKTNPDYIDAPGILSELKWELDMLLKLEHNSKDGSFYVAANYSDDVIYLEDTLYKTSTHESDASERDLRSHLATADMSAVLAHAYIVYKDIPVYEDFAEQCLETALRAWEWATNPSNKKNMSIGAANRTYTFSQKELDNSLYWAAGSLYRALSEKGTDNSEFEDYLIANKDNENVNNCFNAAALSYSHGARAFLGFWNYLYENDSPNSRIAETFSKYETWRSKRMKNDTWGLIMPTWGFWWGSNKYVCQTVMTFVLGDRILYKTDEVQTDVHERIRQHFDYLLGSNPLSFSYVSGHGENSVENIFSAIYSKLARLTPYCCPSGYFTEGANNHNNPHLSKYVGKCYTDSDAEYTTNENTIYGNAAMILLTAAMLSENAPERIRGDVNADGEFNAADLVTLSNWLHSKPESDLADWKSGDLCEDNRINIFDLSLMRKELLK